MEENNIKYRILLVENDRKIKSDDSLNYFPVCTGGVGLSTASLRVAALRT